MMKNTVPHPYWWAVLYGTAVTLLSVFVALMTFVIPHGATETEDNTGFQFATQAKTEPPTTEGPNGETSSAGSDPSTATDSEPETEPETEVPVIITDTSYSDANIKIQISSVRKYNTTLHVVDIQLSSAQYLKTIFVEDTYGSNFTEKPSSMATRKGAILAINGDYYGAREAGIVVRNGTVYRRTAQNATSEALAVLGDGSFQVLTESQMTATAIRDLNAWQVFTFGPALVKDGAVSVSKNTEVDVAATSNPRTAIGMVAPLHYIIIVSDGRTATEQGLTLYQLAGVMQSYGCEIAYNLDGGGSSTLWFNGKIINNPSDRGGERVVSDCVTIGY